MTTVMQRTWLTGSSAMSVTAAVPQITSSPLLDGVLPLSPVGNPRQQQQRLQRSGGLLAERMPGGRHHHSPHGGRMVMTTVAWVSYVQTNDNAQPSAAYGAFWMASSSL